MSKFNPIQTDFTGGEISLKCIGRVDISRYAHSLELCRDFTISPQGGSIRRSGTRWVQEVPDSTKYTRVIDFRFSTLDAVVLEFSFGLIRFYENQGIVLSGMTPYSIVSPYATADIQNIKFTQSADVVFLFHPNYPTQVLSRSGVTSWTIVPMVLVDGPYLPRNYVNGIIQAPSATTMTAPTLAIGASGTCTASNPVFVATDVGRHIRLYNGTATVASSLVGWAIITAYTNSTTVTITAKSAIPTSTGVNWNLGAISATTGYPSCGTFFQQRMVLANTPAQPSGFFMSNSGDFFNFGPSLFDTTVTDACGIAYSIASNQVNSILWMSPSAVLLLGTDGAEWEISSNSYNASPVTPTNIDVAMQTSNGSQQTSRPLRVAWETVFVARTGRDVFKMNYEFQINGFQSKSLSLLGEHIPREGGQLIDIAYQQFPHSVLWFPRQSDGRLAGLTYLSEQDVIGWHLHTIGGTFNGGNAVVESVACIPTPDGTKDQLWMVVKRTIGGVIKRFVEYMEVPYDSSETPTTEMCFMDSASSYSGTPTKTVSGLSYLIGETVSVLADGGVVDNVVVDNTGTITLANAASNITVGYGFVSTMKILRPDGGGSAGTAQGKKKRVNKIVLRLFETLGFEWSTDGITWYQVDFRDASDPMGSAPPLFTGDWELNVDMQTGYSGQFWVRQAQPYPATFLAFMPEETVNQ